MAENNVIRLLEQRKIPFTVFHLPEEKLGAEETAAFLNVPLDCIFKTIVVLREGHGKPLLVVIPGSREVDLKAVAAFLGEKKVRIPVQREAEQLTGLLAGGISPLALINRGFQVLLDCEAEKHTQIHISGGQRGLNILLPVKDLLRLTQARLAPVSRPLQERTASP